MIRSTQVLKIKAGLGYSAFFGKKNSTRFMFEIGPAYRTFFVDDESIEALFPVLIYFMLGFGKGF